MSDWDVVRSFLEQPKQFGPEVTHVEVIETSLSVVFLAGDRAYKLRKPVHLSHVDFSTSASRRKDAEAEFTLNRRTSSSLYLELRTVGVKEGVCQWLMSGEQLPSMESVVVMRRFDARDLMLERVISGVVSSGEMRAVGEVIATFHRDQPEIGRTGSAIETAFAAEQVVGSFVAAPVSSELQQRMIAAGQALRCAIAAVAPWINVRPLKDLHGDLHLGNICICEGLPVLFDCLEYSDALRQIDPIQDFAFLFMDLHARGRRDLAYVVLNEYLELTDDYSGLRILRVMAAHYALVRAMVTAIGPEPDVSVIANYISTAENFLAPAKPFSVLVGGLSGSGKSTVARGLAELHGLIHVRSDVVRKGVMGIGRTIVAPQYAYTDEVSAVTYLRVAEQTALAQSAGFSTVADAVFQRWEQRAFFGCIKAMIPSVPQFPIWLSLPAAEAFKRIAGRTGDVSDADSAVLEAQLRSYNGSSDPSSSEWSTISAEGSPAEVLERVAEHLESAMAGVS
jgi:aminoglycoside phosphotransferase family enzyme/predicted kinase